MYYTQYPSTISNHQSALNSQTQQPNLVPNWQPTVSTTFSTFGNGNTSFPIDTTSFVPPVINSDPCTSQTATSWELFHNLGPANPRNKSQFNLKRRCSDDSEDEPRATKKYITEKMAASLSNLHISGDYKRPKLDDPLPNEVLMEDYELPDYDESDDEAVKEEKGGIILSSEIKKLMKGDQITARLIKNENNKNTMALVVWQPPFNPLLDRVCVSVQEPPDDDDEPNNNVEMPKSQNNQSLQITEIEDEEMDL